MRPRSRSPIPPPREPKRDPYGMQRERDMDRRPGPPMGGRRRSLSPPPHDRSYKRHRHEDDYYDRHDRYGSPPRHHRGRSPDYGRYDDFDPYYGPPPHRHPPPPPPKRHGEPGRGGGGGPPPGPKSFKQFLLDEVPENVTPQQAQVMYEAYLTHHFGDQLRAKFETEKNNEEVRAKYHPSAFEASLARHKEEAAAAAAVLATEIAEGRYDPHLPGFNQGLLEGGGGGADEEEGGEAGAAGPAPAEGPVCLWKPDRAASDYRAAAKLVAVVDAQRGLRLADNLLLPAPAPGAGGANDAMAVDADDKGGQGEGAADAGGAEGAAAGGDGAAPANGAAGGGGEEGGSGGEAAGASDAALPGVLAAIDAEELGCEDDEDALLSRLGRLDQLLTWLWRVHGIDYYGGTELLLEGPYLARRGAARTIRPPRPEEGEEQDEEEAKKDRADLAARVDSKWAARIEGPDPLVVGAQRDEIEQQLNAYVDANIKKENDKNTFSSKFFLERRFVVKHIFNKHGAKLDEQRDVIRERLYWEAYEAAKKAAHAAARAAAQQRESAAAREAAAADGAYGGEGEWQDEGGDGGSGGRGRGGMMRGGRGGMMGRGGPLLMGRGGGRGGPLLGGPPLLGELPLVDPAMMMMGGLPGPIILPGPGMVGGLPLGAPMVLDPAALLGGVGPDLPIFMPPGGGGRGMMRGGMRGGRGGRGGGRMMPPGTKLEGPGYLKHYYDLDAPANNRAVLDYGDL